MDKALNHKKFYFLAVIYYFFIFACFYRIGAGEVGFFHDSLTYFGETNILLGKTSLQSLGNWTFFRGPIYPLFLALVKFFSSEYFFQVLFYLQYVLLILISILFFLRMKDNCDPRFAFLISVCLISFPNLLSVFGVMSTEVLFFPLFIYLLTSFFQENGPGRTDFILVAILCWVRESGIIIYMGMYSYYFLGNKRHLTKTKIVFLSVSLICALCPILWKSFLGHNVVEVDWERSFKFLMRGFTNNFINFSYMSSFVLIALSNIYLFKKIDKSIRLSFLTMLFCYLMIIVFSNLFIDNQISLRSRLMLPFFFLGLTMLCGFRERISVKNPIASALLLAILFNSYSIWNKRNIEPSIKRSFYLAFMEEKSKDIKNSTYLTNAPILMNVILDRFSMFNIEGKRSNYLQLSRYMKSLEISELIYYEVSPIGNKIGDKVMNRGLAQEFFDIELVEESIPVSVYKMKLISSSNNHL